LSATQCCTRDMPARLGARFAPVVPPVALGANLVSNPALHTRRC
jgi:hypothetical protein